MLHIGDKKLRNRVKLSTKVKTCVPNLAVVRRFDCICDNNIIMNHYNNFDLVKVI